MQHIQSIQSLTEEKAMLEQLISPKKFELVKDDFIVNWGCKLFRIRALINFGRTKIGELGGYVEKEGNLSQLGAAWISNDARVYGNAKVYGNAYVSERARVSDHARVYGDTRVCGDAFVSDNAQVYEDALVFGEASISGYSQVYGGALVHKNVEISGNAQVFGGTCLTEGYLSGQAWVSDDEDMVWFPHVDREHYSLTVYRTQTGFELTHGLFCGTPEAFLQIVVQRHGHSRTAREYELLLEYAQSRLQAHDFLQEATA